MSDPFDTDYSADETDVGLDEEGKKFAEAKDEWLKMTKGQALRGAFVYFHTIDSNGVSRARAEAKKKGAPLTPERAKEIGRRLLEEKAQALGKTVDKLTPVERLDFTEAKFKNIKAHYQAGNGYFLSRLGKDGAEADAVWRKLDEPKQYFTTLLLVYPTNAKGDIGENEKPRLMTDWKLIPWRFGKPQFERIWKLNAGLKENNLSLATQDIKLECKEAQYQNIDVTFQGAAIWLRSPKFQQLVIEQALEMYGKLIPFRELSTEQLRAKLGLSAPSGGFDVGADFDTSSILDNV